MLPATGCIVRALDACTSRAGADAACAALGAGWSLAEPLNSQDVAALRQWLHDVRAGSLASCTLAGAATSSCPDHAQQCAFAAWTGLAVGDSGAGTWAPTATTVPSACGLPEYDPGSGWCTDEPSYGTASAVVLLGSQHCAGGGYASVSAADAAGSMEAHPACWACESAGRPLGCMHAARAVGPVTGGRQSTYIYTRWRRRRRAGSLVPTHMRCWGAAPVLPTACVHV